MISKIFKKNCNWPYLEKCINLLKNCLMSLTFPFIISVWISAFICTPTFQEHRSFLVHSVKKFFAFQDSSKMENFYKKNHKTSENHHIFQQAKKKKTFLSELTCYRNFEDVEKLTSLPKILLFVLSRRKKCFRACLERQIFYGTFFLI